MRLVILAQEEPALMGPFLCRLLEARRGDVVGVGLAALRGSGRPARTAAEAVERARTLWTLFEPRRFARHAAVRAAWRLMPSAFPERSVGATARRLGVPVLPMADPNRADFLEALRRLRPDVILNQTDLLLRRPLLRVPRIAVINRHGSRLPAHRGRLGSFWQHYLDGDEGALWVTVHLVDEGLDCGAIVVRRSFPIDPGAGYGEVLERVFAVSADVVCEALTILEAPGFAPIENPPGAGSSHGHPTLADARAFRQVLARRRASGQGRAGDPGLRGGPVRPRPGGRRGGGHGLS